MWHFFLVFLTFIWVLICIWFAMICNVVWKVLTGDAAEDTRSDDEEESEEAEDVTPCVQLQLTLLPECHTDARKEPAPSAASQDQDQERRLDDGNVGRQGRGRPQTQVAPASLPPFLIRPLRPFLFLIDMSLWCMLSRPPRKIGTDAGLSLHCRPPARGTPRREARREVARAEFKSDPTLPRQHDGPRRLASADRRQPRSFFLPQHHSKRTMPSYTPTPPRSTNIDRDVTPELRRSVSAELLRPDALRPDVDLLPSLPPYCDLVCVSNRSHSHRAPTEEREPERSHRADSHHVSSHKTSSHRRSTRDYTPDEDDEEEARRRRRRRERERAEEDTISDPEERRARRAERKDRERAEEEDRYGRRGEPEGGDSKRRRDRSRDSHRSRESGRERERSARDDRPSREQREYERQQQDRAMEDERREREECTSMNAALTSPPLNH